MGENRGTGRRTRFLLIIPVAVSGISGGHDGKKGYVERTRTEGREMSLEFRVSQGERTQTVTTIGQ
jgi:hypothetical protein